MKNIVIIGSGFAALTAIRCLRAKDKQINISVISPKCEFQYLPSLIWVPENKRRRDDIIISLDHFFKRMRVNHIAAKATGLSDDGRTVLTDHGEVENDALIICSGGRFIKKLPGIEHAITPCEGWDAAAKIRDRLKTMQGGHIAIGFSGNPNEPSAMRGGPMFEFLFGIERQLRTEGRRDQFTLTFFTPAERPGQRLGDKAVDGLLKTMQRHKIDTHLGHKIKRFDTDKVVTEGGEFPADLILFMPGMTGNRWFDQTALSRSPGGLLAADKYCQVVGAERVYVAGDSGSFPGPGWLPKQAHMADLQAEAAAHNLLKALNNQPPTETYKVELMCVVDSGDKGIYISRNLKGGTMLPALRLMHWAKVGLERWYLRKYR